MDVAINDKKRPPYGIITILMIGAFITFLNNTLLNVALPAIMEDLQVNMATVQWLTTGFMLVNGVMIPTTAFLIEKYSVRHLFLVAMGLFTVGTVIAAISPVFLILLIARMFQASGAAIMMPLLMNVLLVSFPVQKRGTVMGFLGLIMTFAPAIGPTLSGWIIGQFNWRALFYLVAPIAMVCLLFGFILLKDTKEKLNIRLDKLSLLLSSLGFGLLLLGFSSAGNTGWGHPLVIVTLLIGTGALVFFIIHQNKLERPMLNFHVFKYSMFSLSASISIVVFMAMFSGFLLLPIYAQEILRFTPMESGLMLLPGALISAVMSPINGRLFDKFGGRFLAVLGLSILIVTTYLFSHLTLHTTFVQIAVLHAIRMFGMSMVMMPVQTNGLNQLPPHLYPHGTAMNNTLNQVSGAIGTALLITIMSLREKTYAVQLSKEAIANSVNGTISAEVKQQIAMKAMLGGINDTFFISCVIIVVALILAFFMKRATQENNEERRTFKTKPVTQN